MQACWKLELDKDDACLEVPWASSDGTARFFDLRRRPELLLDVLESQDNRELGESLTAFNQPESILQTAKCDIWLTDDLGPEEEIFRAHWKFGSYVDLIFVDDLRQTSLETHEEFSECLIQMLAKAPDFAARAEVVLRRCYYHRGHPPDMENSDDGFCATLYLYGYGDEQGGAQKNWVIGLKLVQNAVMQMSASRKSRGW